MVYHFTADEHYGHGNVIRYENRPFTTIEEMDETLIDRHNSIVGKQDFVVHLGDFCLRPWAYVKDILARLKGNHIFVRGSHDWWWAEFLKAKAKGEDPSLMGRLHPSKDISMWIARFDPHSGAKDGHGQIQVVGCHYPMRSWAASNHGSWQLHGHCHGHMQPIGKQLDVGVDCHEFYPISFLRVMSIMQARAENPPEDWREGD